MEDSKELSLTFSFSMMLCFYHTSLTLAILIYVFVGLSMFVGGYKIALDREVKVINIHAYNFRMVFCCFVSVCLRLETNLVTRIETHTIDTCKYDMMQYRFFTTCLRSQNHLDGAVEAKSETTRLIALEFLCCFSSFFNCNICVCLCTSMAYCNLGG